MSVCADYWSETIGRHLADQDEGWQADLEKWHRTEQATDELRHNLEWENVLHWITCPQLYLAV